MAVRVLSAPPGGGKTANLTRFGIDLYKEQNPFIYRRKKDYLHYLSIYSNYPVLLWYQKNKFKYIIPNGEIKDSVPIKLYYDKKIRQKYYVECKEEEREYYGVFALKVRFTDMRIEWNFGHDSSFLIDEVQYIYDSMEYKDFPDCIAHFLQVHRHLDYHMIYTNSQSLSRVIKRLLCVSEEFWNVIEYKNLFLLPFITKVKFKITNDIQSSKNDENDKTVKENVEYKNIYFLNKRTYRGYISKYLKSLNDELPYYNMESYNSLAMNKKDILHNFNITKSEKEKLKNMEF